MTHAPMSPTLRYPHADPVGRRICVYGPSGSGKTTFARRLGALLRLPVIELDALFHQPGWRPTPEAEFRAKVRDALTRCPDGWVTDGNYGVVKSVVLPHADTVVWLQPAFLPTYWRLLRRTVTRAWRREELWNMNRETFRHSFASRDSILLWGITHWRAHRRNALRYFATIDHHARVVLLRNDREVERWLAQVEARGR